jgi:hypothetical protein
MTEKPKWLKTKGYIHLTPNLSISNWKSILKKIENPEFIKEYCFFPLIHRVIRERKFKKIDTSKHTPNQWRISQAKKLGKSETYRAHKHVNSKNNMVEPTRKDREIFYASHFDALIYSYYSNLINDLYCETLRKDELLDQSIIAYRKIPVNRENPDGEGKSTIHFSKEVFDEIERQSKIYGAVGVLAFDITNFFPSMNYDLLKEAWINLVGYKEFEKHHFKIFKACTDFRYVNFHELKRIENYYNKGFNEARLDEIRKKQGIKCIFKSYSEFREVIRTKALRVYNPHYRRKNGKGIPPGLPISATLANLYLLRFDETIVNELVKTNNVFYRRYSDDIIIVCPFDQISNSESKVITLIDNVQLEISKHKTERYKFRLDEYDQNGNKRLECFLVDSDFNELQKNRLIYLGFEYYGFQTLIKSTNLAKYYRRLIKTVARRAKRASIAKRNEPTSNRAIFYSQIKKTINKPLKDDIEKADGKKHYRLKRCFLKKDSETGEFKLKVINNSMSDADSSTKKASTYMGYIRRCVKIHKSPKFLHQLRKRKYILNVAINRKLTKYLK